MKRCDVGTFPASASAAPFASRLQPSGAYWGSSQVRNLKRNNPLVCTPFDRTLGWWV